MSSGYPSRLGGLPSPEKWKEGFDYQQVIAAKDGTSQIILLGDSHMHQIAPSLAEAANEIGVDFVNGTIDGCPFLVGIDLLESARCDAELNEERLMWVGSFEPSFVVLGARYPLALHGTLFDNKEGGVEPGSDAHWWSFVGRGQTEPNYSAQEALGQDSIRESIESLLYQGHSVVLVYPTPEMGWDVPQEIMNRVRGIEDSGSQSLQDPFKLKDRILPGPESWPLADPVTIAYQTFYERSQSSFEALDSVASDRISRVYPHLIFCDVKKGGRCASHDDEDIFYTDHDHLSTAGADLVVKEIISSIKQQAPLAE